MKKSVKIALYGIPVLLGIYLIYRQLRNKKSSTPYIPPITPQPPVNPVRTPEQISSNCKFPLKRGVYNCDLVEQLKWALNRIPITDLPMNNQINVKKYRPLAEDGDFGAKTEAVLSDFWSGTPGGENNSVLNQEDMNTILSYVITDPVAFQEAENPYIMAPQQPTPTNPPFTPFPRF
jgi:hypothetical protein